MTHLPHWSSQKPVEWDPLPPSLLIEKQQQPYSRNLFWKRCKLSFSLQRSAIMRLRGAHSSLHHPAGPLTGEPMTWSVLKDEPLSKIDNAKLTTTTACFLLLAHDLYSYMSCQSQMRQHLVTRLQCIKQVHKATLIPHTRFKTISSPPCPILLLWSSLPFPHQSKPASFRVSFQPACHSGML